MAAGAALPTLEAIAARHILDRPADFWHVIMGSGYRGTVDTLDPEARTRLHHIVDEGLAAERVLEISVDVLYGLARKPL